MDSSVRNRLIVFLVSLVAGLLFLLPTIFPDKFSEKGSWISQPISLGLDLRGGVHLVYKVDIEDAIKSRVQSRGNALGFELREQKIPVIRVTGTQAGRIEILLASSRRADDAKQLIEGQHRDLRFVESVAEGERQKLVFMLADLNVERITNETVSQSIDTLNNRVNQFGVSEPLIQRVGNDRIMVQMPGITDIEAVKRVVGSVAKLEFRLVPVPGGNVGSISVKDRSGVTTQVEDVALMTGTAVQDARWSTQGGQVEVLLTLTTEGTRAFRRITTENVGRQLAIVLDNVLYSSPNIREPITHGMASISGGFTVEEASELAIVLRAGALPARLIPIEERTVGPTLGQESIEKGITAILVGFTLIVLFMLFYYKKSGALAIASLAVNGFLMMAFLSAFGATLTLPGLAGLALTLGMAVDSNVIIFERIRDELRLGATRDAAISAGFDRAFSAILDSNLTTLLAGFVLYIFGSGPIKGFAVTLSIGVLTTLYCATFVSRLGFDLFMGGGDQKRVSI